METPVVPETNSKRVLVTRPTWLSRTVRYESSVMTGSMVRATSTRSALRRFSHTRSPAPLVGIVCRSSWSCPRSLHPPTPTWSTRSSPKAEPAVVDLLHSLHHGLLNLCGRWYLGVPPQCNTGSRQTPSGFQTRGSHSVENRV